MEPLELGIGFGGRRRHRSAAGPIAAWGDSLTAGAGASSAAYRYPAAAAALFVPHRRVFAHGVGGQTSTQIAARQGGVPILLTLEGDEIPALGAQRTWHWGFGAGLEGWVSRNQDGQSPLSMSDGALHWTVEVATSRGPQVWLGETFPTGTVFNFALDVIEQAPGTILEIGPLHDPHHEITGATAGAWCGEPWNVWSHGPGRVTGTITVTEGGSPESQANIFAVLTNPHNALGAHAIGNVTLTAVPAPAEVAVTARSVDVLFDSGTHSGSMAGTLAGVHGLLTTDAAGNWTFARDSEGPAVACPAGSAFIPDAARAMRARTAWIWAGRNNASAPGTVKADIAAMVAHLGHERFIIGGVINGNYENEFAGGGQYAVITALNADLGALYGERFIDLRAALVAAADPVADAIWIERDTVPGSLRSDDIHLNDAGYAIVAAQMHAATIAMGW